MSSKTKVGKSFEEQWKESYSKTPHFIMRLKDAAKWTRGEDSAFTPSNECDSIQYALPFLWLIELKSTKGTGISFNPKEPWEKPKNSNSKVMIKANQVKALMKAVKKPGIIAGFVVNYRPRQLKKRTTENLVYFIHIDDFVQFAVNSDKSSLGVADCEQIGVKVEWEKLKVNYRYNIDKMVNDGVVRYLKCGHLDISIINKLKRWVQEIEQQI